MNELKELEIEEVSLVDAGANPSAEIVLFKRKKKAAAEKIDKATVLAATFCKRLEKRLEEHLAKAERDELLKIASKYEILGEKKEELAEILKVAKGTELYDKILANLDRELALVEKQGLFEEVGKRSRDAGFSVEELKKKFMSEDSKLTERQALDKAFTTMRAMR